MRLNFQLSSTVQDYMKRLPVALTEEEMADIRYLAIFEHFNKTFAITTKKSALERAIAKCKTDFMQIEIEMKAQGKSDLAINAAKTCQQRQLDLLQGIRDDYDIVENTPISYPNTVAKGTTKY